MARSVFEHDGFRLAYLDQPASAAGAETVLLIHGFASSIDANWFGPSWMKTLGDAGYRVVALDNRGHGQSSKSYEPADYAPEKMASDAVALLDQLSIGKAHFMGYSMGARIAAFAAMIDPDRVATLVFGGLGIGMVEGVGNWGPIAAALIADDPAKIEGKRARMFRTFADQTRSDRAALAACIESSRTLIAREDIARITQPTLVAVGTMDDISGPAAPLAALMPRGESFDIEGRDHMLSVGDRTFKQRVVAFLADHPIG